MHLQVFLAICEVSVAQFHIIIFICHLAEKIDAMKLVEDLKANSISLNSSLWIRGSQVRFRHINDLQLFVGNNLVTDYKILISRFKIIP